MMKGDQDPRFLKGIDEFNRRLFFECHETLEEIWQEHHGADRKFYQGMIQIAAGYFKWEQGVPAGAIKLWRMGLEKLHPYGPSHFGINLEAFVEAVKEHLTELENARARGLSGPSLDPPTVYRIN